MRRQAAFTAGWWNPWGGGGASAWIPALLAPAMLFLTAMGATAQEAAKLRPSGSEGVIRALIAGIDDYKNTKTVPKLKGAVADARDIQTALQHAGVSDITVLTDQQVSRDRLMQAFQALARRTGPSDLVIVTFAGHGTQDDERVRGSEPDRQDELFLLRNFGNSGSDTKERLLDDEIFDLLGKLASSGAQVVFVADTCHGGGLTKAPDAAAEGVSMRGIRKAGSAAEAGPGAFYIAPGEDLLAVDSGIPADDDATRVYPSLTLLAGADDQTNVPETAIPGETSLRGAASYVFARALQGQADEAGNHDGVTTRAELMAFFRREVSRLTGGKQSVVFEPRDLASASTPLFRTGGAPAVQTAAPADGKQDARPPVPQQAKDAPLASQGKALQHVAIDTRTGNIVSTDGAVLAFGVASHEAEGLAGRFEAEARFKLLQKKQPLPASLVPAMASYAEGDDFSVKVSGLYGRHLILLNLTGGGRVQYLFPRGQTDPLQHQDVMVIPLRAEPPFGSDTLILLATQKRLRDLEQDLSGLDGKAAALAAFESAMLQLGTGDSVAVVSYRTRPR